jgi:hypothetical protein
VPEWPALRSTGFSEPTLKQGIITAVHGDK